MRTIKAVIHIAIKLLDETISESFTQGQSSEDDSSRSLEQLNIETKESSILCRALREVNLPRFITSDA